ncbi:MULTISPECIES: chromate transporter [Acinetobacter calcoaceticus/baumannii complex]|uniref:chromate transporter n=1 Tax=Acinetobacter calcoaceticus/baumannii complex TaxID=909768 RepID=UPI00244876BB|nr:chromate transporter [Acinetobacter baumannii]MDH2605230.1 chromate transporter [Acinetobacter baumannii]MDK2101958.1 chromate transporter [Acinetobacter baumannii]MDK2148198.1 chromate transporter [Acinetobacter baumannii]MDK2177329.1 chromate transporter [Acinetobacter baumannii]MDK2195636.1 chromate transporter [Acinetobacter baumannii]
MGAILLTLAIIFTQLSLIAFGGGNTILPEMQRQVVDIHHWMTAQEFSALFAMAQAAPGPNMMIVPLVGWHVAGLSGLLVTSTAKFLPSSLITVFVMRGWSKFKDKKWRRVLQLALQPVTVGTVLASAWIISEAAAINTLLIIMVVIATLLSLIKKVHPLHVLIAGAVFGVVLL